MKYEEWFEIVLNHNDFITTDKYLNCASKCGYKYVKTDYLYSFGKWRGALQTPLILSQIRNFQRIGVFGHSDFSVGNKSLRFLHKIGFRKIFGVNTLNQMGYSESIPIGITNDCDDSPIHKILGDISHFRKAHEYTNTMKSFNGTFYVNFTTSNNTSERGKLLKILDGMPSVKYSSVQIDELGRIEYLRNLRCNSLVPAPEGNGFDTHRLWETLYMGGTPVIKTCAYLPLIISELPVIVLNDWNQLQDLSQIEAKWEEAQIKRGNWEYLRASYWINRMAQSVGKVSL